MKKIRQCSSYNDLHLVQCFAVAYKTLPFTLLEKVPEVLN